MEGTGLRGELSPASGREWSDESDAMHADLTSLGPTPVIHRTRDAEEEQLRRSVRPRIGLTSEESRADPTSSSESVMLRQTSMVEPDPEAHQLTRCR